MTDLKECRKGSHKLNEITRYQTDSIGDIEAVVRWCEVCGSVVVDSEYDGRVKPGYYRKMVLPQLAKEVKE